jgi:hypothetical protein
VRCLEVERSSALNERRQEIGADVPVCVAQAEVELENRLCGRNVADGIDRRRSKSGRSGRGSRERGGEQSDFHGEGEEAARTGNDTRGALQFKTINGGP